MILYCYKLLENGLIMVGVEWFWLYVVEIILVSCVDV